MKYLTFHWQRVQMCYHQIMPTVYIALGSNVGDSKKYLAQAEELLEESLARPVSALIYSSKPVGYTDQADFLNTVVCGETELAPAEFLKLIKAVEVKIGRTPTFRWGPREIDIDLIFYDDMVMDDPDLTLPHPRYAQRDFVLKPLCDLCPDLLDPVNKQPVKTLLENISPKKRSITGTA